MNSSKITWTNWSKSFNSQAEKIVFPESEEEIISIVKDSYQNNSKIKLFGSGHSCSLIAETNSGILMSLDKFNNIISFNREKMEIKVEAGIRLYDLCYFLKKNNAALSNMGTIDSQSLAGAIATGTHGTGINFGAIDQQIIAMEIITGTGDLIKISAAQNQNLFQAAKVNIGALGIISSITLKVEPNYNLEVNTSTLTFNEMLNNLALIDTTDYLRFWWAPHTNKVQLWQANKTDDKEFTTNTLNEWFQGVFKGNILHEFGLWITSFFPNKVPVLNKVMYHLLFKKEVHTIGNWHDMFTLPIHVKQSVMEYAIPIENTVEAIQEMKNAIDKNFKVHMPIELRFTPENDALLSMAHKRQTCYIGIISYKPYGKEIPHDIYFEKIHSILKKYEARPHWAKKHFFTKTELANLYPNWEDFKKLKIKLDPKGVFENDFLKKLF